MKRINRNLFCMIFLVLLCFATTSFTVKATNDGIDNKVEKANDDRFDSTSPWLKDTQDDSIYSNPVDAGEKDQDVSAKKPGMVEKYIAELIRNIGSGLISLLQDNIGASLDNIVYGRVGSGQPNKVNIYSFELRKGNPYGVTAAVCYALLRGMMFIFLAIMYIFQLAKASWSGQTAKSREEIKSILPTMVVKFIALMLMPYFLDTALYVRDILLYGIKEMTGQMITGGATLSLSKAFLLNAERSGTFVDAIMYLGTVVLSIYFVFIYVAVAIDMLVCFVSFPFICIMHTRKKNLISSWSINVFSNIMTPIIDAVLLLIPLLTSMMLSDVIKGVAIIQLVMCMLIIPARQRFKTLLSIQSNEKNGFTGFMALMALSKAAVGRVRQGAHKIAETFSDAKKSRMYGEMEEIDKEEEATYLTNSGDRKENRGGNIGVELIGQNEKENQEIENENINDFNTQSETENAMLETNLQGNENLKEDIGLENIPNSDRSQVDVLDETNGSAEVKENLESIPNSDRSQVDVLDETNGSAEVKENLESIPNSDRSQVDVLDETDGSAEVKENLESIPNSDRSQVDVLDETDGSAEVKENLESISNSDRSQVDVLDETDGSAEIEENPESISNTNKEGINFSNNINEHSVATNKNKLLRNMDQSVNQMQKNLDELRVERAGLIKEDKQLKQKMLNYKKGSPEYSGLEKNRAAIEEKTAEIDEQITIKNQRINQLRQKSKDLRAAMGIHNTPTIFDERRKELLRKRANISNFEQPEFRNVLDNKQMHELYKKRAIANATKFVTGTATSVVAGGILGGSAMFMGSSTASMGIAGGMSLGETIGEKAVDVALEVKHATVPVAKFIGKNAYHAADMAASAYLMNKIKPTAMQIELDLGVPIETNKTKSEFNEPSINNPTNTIQLTREKIQIDTSNVLYQVLDAGGNLKNSTALKAMQSANLDLEKEVAQMREENVTITEEIIREKRVATQTEALSEVILKRIEKLNAYGKETKNYEEAKRVIQEKIKAILEEKNKPLL